MLTAPFPSMSPTPTVAPTLQCVVDSGSPILQQEHRLVQCGILRRVQISSSVFGCVVVVAGRHRDPTTTTNAAEISMAKPLDGVIFVIFTPIAIRILRP